jgi:hypothetical protein
VISGDDDAKEPGGVRKGYEAMSISSAFRGDDAEASSSSSCRCHRCSARRGCHSGIGTEPLERVHQVPDADLAGIREAGHDLLEHHAPRLPLPRGIPTMFLHRHIPTFFSQSSSEKSHNGTSYTAAASEGSAETLPFVLAVLGVLGSAGSQNSSYS